MLTSTGTGVITRTALEIFAGISGLVNEVLLKKPKIRALKV
jgi:hypothetical protein